MAPLTPLAASDLRKVFDPNLVPFETSDQAGVCQEAVLGQDRAKKALEFGLNIDDMDFHVFVDGPSRTGKTHLVRTYLEKLAATQPPPPDWVYVHNFLQPEEPLALQLPNGGGRKFAKRMEWFVDQMLVKVPENLDGDQHRREKDRITGEYKSQRSRIFSNLDKEARETGFVMRVDQNGIMVAPADEKGEQLEETVIRDMEEKDREELRARADQMQAKVTEAVRQVQDMENKVDEELSELEKNLARMTMRRLLKEVGAGFEGLPEVVEHLRRVEENVLENLERFKKKEQGAAPFPFATPSDDQPMREYKVNVFVDNSQVKGAPVVVENHPTYPNIFGRIERQARFGALMTDFTLLTPGALHKANGGYLVLPVQDVLMYWLPWQALKRALRDRRLSMEDPGEELGMLTTRGLRPAPIPLKLKVILIGDSRLHGILYNMDPQFSKLFRVRAQMSEWMELGQPEIKAFMEHVCDLANKSGLLPLHRTAMAKLLELAGELAGDRERLTLRLSHLEEVVKESAFLAQKSGRPAVMGQDVDQAVADRRHRSSMLEERLRDAALRGFLNIETVGEKIGQINGLAVADLGDYSFGRASRITASVGLGKEGVVAIDREADLSGPFHNKGVLILGGFLRDRFGRERPLALTASLVFEQSYSMIDGDSASLAELLVLLSRLSGLPLRQDLAVTGSVSQMGQVQAIGGVNQKVEGFFRLCQARGLTGGQGVSIPYSNRKSLMLHRDIVAASEDGKFSVYCPATVEEAIELFTGVPAGERGQDGQYPEGTVYYLVERELIRLSEAVKKLSAKPDKAE